VSRALGDRIVGNSEAMDAPGFEFTVDGARRAAQYGVLAHWVRQFLSSPGSDNAVLGEQLTNGERWWIGPLALPIDSLHRLVGPPEDPVLVEVDEEHWRDDVEEMAEKVSDDAWQPPPVVVTYRDDQMVLEDGNHRVEALRRAGAVDAWGVVGFDSIDDRDQFVTRALGSPADAPSETAI
jgi:hypothetical protein